MPSVAATRDILSWNCLDDFAATYGMGEAFYGKRKIEQDKFETVGALFSAVRNKWQQEFIQEFGEVKTLKIAGGNYTFFFVLPYLLKRFVKTHPFLSVNITLLEARELPNLEQYNADAVLTGAFNGKAMDRKIYSKHYTASRRGYKDGPYIATSKASVEKYGSKENAAREQDLLHARIYKTIDFTEIARWPYSTSPIGRHGELPRITIDMIYMGFYYMYHSCGVWLVFRHERRNKMISVISKEPLANITRYCLQTKKFKSSHKKVLHRVCCSFWKKITMDICSKSGIQ